MQQIGLDEALVTVNKSGLVDGDLDLYHQIDQCFGCPLEWFKSLRGEEEQFVVSTKFRFQLELRELVGGINGTSAPPVVCHFNHLDLNEHGHYKIQVSDCTLVTLDKGNCHLCPVLVFTSLLLLFTLAEWFIWSRFFPNNKQQHPKSTIRRHGSTSSDDDQNEATAENPNSTLSVDTVEENKRLESLDAFRGLTIAGMIMVNYGGAGYTWLEHAPWDGLTPADFVFPFFIFAMGASIGLSMSARSAKSSCPNTNEESTGLGADLWKVLCRSFILMAMGVCLNSRWLGEQSLHYLRLTGVLQRFSISYLVVASLYCTELRLNRWIKAQSLYRVPCLSRLASLLCELLLALNLLLCYLYVSLYLDYSPGLCPPGYLGPGGQTSGGSFANCTGGAAAWLDRLVLGTSHLYQDRELHSIFKTNTTHDPEGILGFTTSILLTLIGLQCGKLLSRLSKGKSIPSPVYKTKLKLLLAFLHWCWLLLAAALVSSHWIPINKRLWSLSFVLLTGSVAYLLVGLLYLLIDGRHQQQRNLQERRRIPLARLLISAGQNSLLLYVGHSLLDRLLPWHFAVNQSSHLQLLARLLWATLLWLLLAHYMARKRLFIKL